MGQEISPLQASWDAVDQILAGGMCHPSFKNMPIPYTNLSKKYTPPYTNLAKKLGDIKY